ncbi:YIP1 family protein [Metabacillus herbersteinensis]|uniref:YIP1 family protein n=1 Tax=Metabacillus herbersteinensis TaxID=283816 RepID=A0ABV6GF58_9BACI
MQQVKLLQGLFQPASYYDKQLQTEKSPAFLWKLLAIIGVSTLLSVIASYLGLGTEEIMKSMDKVPPNKLEAAKLYYGIGSTLSGLLFPLFMMLFFATFFWLCTNEESFKGLFTLQFYPITILVIEKLFNLPFYYFTGAKIELSPFAFGPIAQQLTDNSFLILLLSHVSIFLIWAATLQVIALKKATTTRSNAFLITVVIVVHILYIFIATGATILIREIGIVL